MKTLRGLLESLVKSGAWGSLQESSAKTFRQAKMHQKGMESENERMSIAVGEITRRGKAAAARAAAREEAAKKKTAGKVAAKKQEEHAKRYEGEVETLKGLKDGQVASVVVRTQEGQPGEEHHVVRHQGSFFLVGPKGNTREISGNFGGVTKGAINVTNVAKGRGNARVIAQIEAGKQGGVIKRDLNYTMSGGRIKIHKRD
jgi:hypothetical protein